jgi:GNAT superfamily N-acetyltransferase
VGEVRTRLAGPDDALVVAALALQCALHRGGSGEQGFLDRYARAWLASQRQRPVWLAEAGDEHAGFLQATVVEPLPVPSAPVAPVLLVETFFVRPSHRGLGVGELLLRAACEWAADGAFGQVRMTAGPHTRVMVERVGLVPDDGAYRLDLA